MKMARTQTEVEIPYPGVPATADGSEGVAWVEIHISQGACAYPVTPSTNMGVLYAQAMAEGRKNLWGEWFLERESEHSSASTAEGFALAGGRVTNFTSGHGAGADQCIRHLSAGA